MNESTNRAGAEYTGGYYSYDCTGRGWYQEAYNYHNPVGTWSSIYSYAVGDVGQMGMDATAPLFDPDTKEKIGVADVAIGLMSIGHRLHESSKRENKYGPRFSSSVHRTQN